MTGIAPLLSVSSPVVLSSCDVGGNDLGFNALVLPNDVLGEDYALEFTPVIDAKLSLAGIRLAQIANDAFK